MLPTMQAGTVEGEESRSECVKSEMFVWSPRGRDQLWGGMYRHEFQGRVELDMEIWVLAIDR